MYSMGNSYEERLDPSWETGTLKLMREWIERGGGLDEKADTPSGRRRPFKRNGFHGRRTIPDLYFADAVQCIE